MMNGEAGKGGNKREVRRYLQRRVVVVRKVRERSDSGAM
jgi:hypothetical protein